MQLKIRLTPHATQNKIEGWEIAAKGQRILRVKVAAIPEKGKANEALIKLLSRTLQLPKSKMTLIRGAHSQIKEVEIEAEDNMIQRAFEKINSIKEPPFIKK